jgi:hypothetical protein
VKRPRIIMADAASTNTASATVRATSVSVMGKAETILAVPSGRHGY